MGYFDNRAEYEKRGIDHDLTYAIHYNDTDFGVDDIDFVAAVIEGENDGASWHWIVKLKTGQWAYATGWCDYTGWDCQSGMDTDVVATPEAALEKVGAPGSYPRDDLEAQLRDGKHLTWHEQTAQEFKGVLYGLDPTQLRQTVRLAIEQRIEDIAARTDEYVTDPTQPNYEVGTFSESAAMAKIITLWREGVWFVHQRLGENLIEIVVKYEDREHLFGGE